VILEVFNVGWTSVGAISAGLPPGGPPPLDFPYRGALAMVMVASMMQRIGEGGMNLFLFLRR